MLAASTALKNLVSAPLTMLVMEGRGGCRTTAEAKRPAIHPWPTAARMTNEFPIDQSYGWIANSVVQERGELRIVDG